MNSALQGQAGVDRPQPFRMMGGSFTLMVLRLNDPTDPAFFPMLLDKIAQAPNFFRHAPVVLDVEALAESGQPFNFAEFGRRLRQHQLVPVGIQNGNEALNQKAVAAGFSVLTAGRQVADRTPVEAPAQATVRAAAQAVESTPVDAGSPATENGQSLVVTEPVRSGRQIYAHQGDLVVMAPVSRGAELLADGHIHVYGPLRGRALAGVNGDPAARIFCQSLDAELISIAGYWRVREDMGEGLIGKPAQVRLEGERIVIEPLSS